MHPPGAKALTVWLMNVRAKARTYPACNPTADFHNAVLNNRLHDLFRLGQRGTANHFFQCPPL
jgi:hypothetical protein